MVVCPCSGGTLSAIAHGASGNLIHRAADVHLKERRRLILVPRETPLSLVQLDNMRRCAEAGAVVLPAMPGFYHGVHTIRDLVDFVVARICDQLDIEQSLIGRWGECRTSSNECAESMQRLRMILEMIRFSHTVFALPFALLSAVMAWTLSARQTPPVAWCWQEVVGIIACMVFARSAAMAFNRLADRRFDAENPRTAMRHLPAGLLSVASVTAFAIGCAIAFIAATLLFLPNRWPLYLSLPVLGFLLGYSYTKRFTSLAHFWLGRR